MTWTDSHFSSTTWVSQNQNGKLTIMDFNEAQGDGLAITTAEPYANHLQLAWERQLPAPYCSNFPVTQLKLSKHWRQIPLSWGWFKKAAMLLNISQDSKTFQVWIFKDDSVTTLPLSMTAKRFWKYVNICRHLLKYGNNNNNYFTTLCLGPPEWAGTRRNIHPLTPILIINHLLSVSSIYYNP